jgi:hypothetical protein
MAEAKLMIAARGPLFLNAAAIGEKNDRFLATGETFDVPESYAKHLIADRFADGVSADEAKRIKKEAAAAKASEKEDAAAKAAAKALADAEKAVDDAETALAAAGDDDAKAKAEADMKAAQDALAALKA